jgi:glucose 1-dehydrogenase
VFDLSGRVALVTGSRRRIGWEIALGLAEQGADVAVHCATRTSEADAVARAVADLGDASTCRKLIAATELRLGSIDILVLNASVERRRDWLEIAVNLRSILILLQGALPSTAKRGWERVLSIGSIQESKPNPQLVIYAALKAAQTSMIVNLARQYARHGVTLNNLAPGAIATERNAALLEDPTYRARVEAQMPMGIRQHSSRHRLTTTSTWAVS